MITKINAVKESDRILVKATYYEDDVLVHEVNRAFPLDTEESVIREEVEKAGELYELEKKQAKNQEEVDKLHEKADETIKNLTSQPEEEQVEEK